MSDFGDLEPDDVVATEPADPEQVARRIHDWQFDDDLTPLPWDDLAGDDRIRRIAVAAAVLAWLTRQGSHP